MSIQVKPSTRDADVLRLLAQVADLRERIGQRIKAARLAKTRDNGEPWTQGDLARALPGTVEASSVSRWETGKVKPEDETLDALAEALDVDVSYFYVPEPQPGTADLMASLEPNGSQRQLDRIEAKLDALLKLLDGEKFDPAGALDILLPQAPDRSETEDPASQQERPRRRQKPRAA